MSCERLHEIVNEGLRFKRKNGGFTNSDRIPKNGIYLMFENGEEGHGKDRIVRIGTHKGQDRLPIRLNQHFVQPRKDSSIFRKNIGRCFLNMDDDLRYYLPIWDMVFITRATREEYGQCRDMDFEGRIEERITKYLRSNMSFVLIRVDECKRRLSLERRLITTVNRCNNCGPSENWLGNTSPKQKIKESGLWLVQNLNGEQTIEDNDLEYIGDYIIREE